MINVSKDNNIYLMIGGGESNLSASLNCGNSENIYFKSSGFGRVLSLTILRVYLAVLSRVRVFDTARKCVSDAVQSGLATTRVCFTLCGEAAVFGLFAALNEPDCTCHLVSRFGWRLRTFRWIGMVFASMAFSGVTLPDWMFLL